MTIFMIMIMIIIMIEVPDYEKVKLNFKGYETIVVEGIQMAKRKYFERVL